MSALSARIDALFEDRVSMRALAIVRMAAAPIVYSHLRPFLRDRAAGTWYGEHFYVPWVSWYPEAPEALYNAILVGAVVCAVLLSLGVATRVTSKATLALVAYNFFLSQTFFRHNRNFLLIVLAALALTPCGRVLSVDAWWRRWRGRPALADAGPRWVLVLLRFEMACMYLASGGSKLLDPDWWSGLVTWKRVIRYQHHLYEHDAPRWLIDLLKSTEFHWVFAKTAILSELFIAGCVWFPATRLAAVWVAVCFHGMIEMSAAVQIFSYLAIVAQLVWAVPTIRDRRLIVRTDRRAGRYLARAVRALDWMARFRIETSDDPRAPAVRLIDRGGVERDGAAAARVALSRCPLLFMPIAPTLLPGLRAGWDRLFRRTFG